MLAAADRRSIAKHQPEPERRRNIADFTGGRNTRIMLINLYKYSLTLVRPCATFVDFANISV